MSKDYTKYTREQLIAELERSEKYNKLVLTAVRHYAMQLLDELNKLRPEND